MMADARLKAGVSLCFLSPSSFWCSCSPALTDWLLLGEHWKGKAHSMMMQKVGSRDLHQQNGKAEFLFHRGLVRGNSETTKFECCAGKEVMEVKGGNGVGRNTAVFKGQPGKTCKHWERFKEAKRWNPAWKKHIKWEKLQQQQKWRIGREKEKPKGTVIPFFVFTYSFDFFIQFFECQLH